MRFVSSKSEVSTITTLRFKKCPPWVIIESVYLTVLSGDTIPAWVTGILAIYSLREIITGMKMDFKNYCKLDFGEDVEVRDEPTTTNGMKSSTKTMCCIRPYWKSARHIQVHEYQHRYRAREEIIDMHPNV